VLEDEGDVLGAAFAVALGGGDPGARPGGGIGLGRARAGRLAGRRGGFEVVVGGGREAGGGQQREEKQRPRGGPVTWDRGSDLGSAKIVRSVRGGGGRDRRRGVGGSMRAVACGRSESTHGVDIGSGAHLMTRVTRVPVTQSGSGHLLKHLFLSARSKIIITFHGRAH